MQGLWPFQTSFTICDSHQYDRFASGRLTRRCDGRRRLFSQAWRGVSLHCALQVDPSRGASARERSRSTARIRSPLLALSFWRVVLDEAQMVESSTAMASAMALQLAARNRWAVSGTPMGKGRLADLHGLFSFLRVEPWAERAWFQHAFERPFSAQSGPVAASPAPADPSHARTVRKRRLSEPDDGALETTLSQAATGDRAAREGALVSLSEASARAEVVERRTAAHLLLCELFRLMWRSTKRSVEAELGLAAPSVVTHSLAFSSIEAHFYKKQHAKCVRDAAHALRKHEAAAAHECSKTVAADKRRVKLDDTAQAAGVKVESRRVSRRSDVDSAGSDLLERLSQPLLRLRQACCHPQLGSFGIRQRRKEMASRRRRAAAHAAAIRMPMSMEAVLSHLIETERTGCEEGLRKALLNLSAWAAICAMEGRDADAANKYAEARALSKRVRVPLPMERTIEVKIVGPSSFQGPEGSIAAASPFGPLLWFPTEAMRLSAVKSKNARVAAEDVPTLSDSDVPDADAVTSVNVLSNAIAATATSAGSISHVATDAMKAATTDTDHSSLAAAPAASGSCTLSASHAVAEPPSSSQCAANEHGSAFDGVVDGNSSWVRLELTKPKRICQLALRLPGTQRGPAGHEAADHGSAVDTSTSVRCLLRASAAGDSNHVFVDVCKFDVSQDSSEWQYFPCYRAYKSKVWMLHVESIADQALQSVVKKGRAVSLAQDRIFEIREMQLFEAEVETDPMQLLHVTYNLARAVCRLESAAASANSDSTTDSKRTSTNNLNDSSPESHLNVHRNNCRLEAAGQAVSTTADTTPVPLEEAAPKPFMDSPFPRSTSLAGIGVETCPAAPASASLNGPLPLSSLPPSASLRRECDALRTQISAERAALQRSSQVAFNEARTATEQAMQEASSLDWLERLCRHLERDTARSSFLRERLISDEKAGAEASRRCGSWTSMLDWIASERERRIVARRQLVDEIVTLPQMPSEAEVAESGSCGYCRQDWGKTGPKCKHCKREALYSAYEATFFNYRRQRKVEISSAAFLDGDAGAAAANQTEAFRDPLPVVEATRLIVRWLGSQTGAGSAWAALFEEASKELELMTQMARELQRSRALWSAHFDLLSQLDELASATSTMRLTDSPEEKAALPEVEQHVLVGTWELDERRAVYVAEYANAQTELRLAQAQLRFLSQGGHAENDCPICMLAVGSERMVSSCGHSLCAACAESISRRHAGRFVCPECKRVGTLSLVTALQWVDGSSAGTAVKGNFGTKVTAVVETVLGLPDNDKCLVFSQWDEMLTLLSQAFEHNGIVHGRISGKARLEATLSAFKTEPSVRALLLPLSSGANGLNLVEATHVLLVEPLLNGAVEAQAIGRVHRISQLRPTTVHRFVVRNTVEEAIHRMRGPTHSRDRAISGEVDDDGSAELSPNAKQKHAEESNRLTWQQVRVLFQNEIDLLSDEK